MEKKVAVIDESRCVACSVCVKKCPRGAITIINGCYAHIDEDKCVGCKKCVFACPAGIICGKVINKEA